MIKVIVPISGGKDSQCCLKLARENFNSDEILGLFCDTQFEHAKTYDHIEKIKDMYGVNIKVLCAGSVDEKVIKYGRFPGGGARHCTDELKITPSKKFYKEFALDLGHGFQVWYGMRMDESNEREKRYWKKFSSVLYPPNEILNKYPKYLHKMGITFRLPIIHWNSSEVFAKLNGEHNILYDEGFDRVGCFPCLASGDAWKEKAFNHDDFGREQKKRVIILSNKINKQIFTSKGGIERNLDFSGCSLCSI